MTSFRSRFLAGVLGAATLALAPTVQAQTLSGTLTADNYFTAYLSTSATSLGSALLSGNNWRTTYSFNNAVLTPGQNYYLHIAAGDYGTISGVLGSFSLAGSGFKFANGLQSLNTNTTNWSASFGENFLSQPSNAPNSSQQLSPPVAFGTTVGQSPMAIRSQGNNGVNPWGSQTQISSQAQWIWSQDNCIHCGRYFSTMITSTVPEPTTWALVGTGLVAIAFFGRRRRSV